MPHAPLNSSRSASKAEPSKAGEPSTGAVWLRRVGLLLGAALFAYTLRDLELARLGVVLRELGPLALLVLAPQALGILFHTWAWREVLVALAGRAPFFALLEIFVGSEAARMVLPAGAALGESVAAYGLKERLTIPWSDGLASLAAKKAWVLGTHALCLVLLLALAGAPLDVLSQTLPAGWALRWATAGMTFALCASAVLTLLLLTSPSAGHALARIAGRIPLRSVKSWAAAREASPPSALAALPLRAHVLAAVGMFGQWVTEVLETWLVARLLGLPITLAEAGVVELGGSLVRSLAFMVPGGLGVQDASYVGLLVGLGLPGAEAAAPAFVLLKRAKDVFFVALGLSVFAFGRRRRSHVSVTLLEVGGAEGGGRV